MEAESTRNELSRRKALGMGAAVVPVAVAAWAIPEMVVAEWAGGATLSGGPGELNGPIPPNEAPIPAAVPHSTQTPQGTANPLAFTGANLQSMAELGGALAAGGWLAHHWATRQPKVVTPDEAE